MLQRGRENLKITMWALSRALGAESGGIFCGLGWRFHPAG